MKSLYSADPTIPNKAEYVAGGKRAGLDLELDDLAKGLTGTPENRRATFHDRMVALAKRRDLFFGDIWSLAMARHPEWNESEDLNPRQFAAKLPTRTEREENEKRLAKIKHLQASDPSLTFASAWEQTSPEKSVEMPAPVARPQIVRAEDPPKDLPPGVFLVHGAQAGMICPLFED